jgi:ABC-type proline/glycine betaine transport system substrate-binding protein
VNIEKKQRKKYEINKIGEYMRRNRRGMNRGGFMRAVGAGAAGMAGLGMMGSGVAHAASKPIKPKAQINVAVGNYWPGSMFSAGIIMGESILQNKPWSLHFEGRGVDGIEMDGRGKWHITSEGLYAGVANGEIDCHVVGWLPETHAERIEALKNDRYPLLQMYGPNVDNNFIGFVTPKVTAEAIAYELGKDVNELLFDDIIQDPYIMATYYNNTLQTYQYTTGMRTKLEEIYTDTYKIAEYVGVPQWEALVVDPNILPNYPAGFKFTTQNMSLNAHLEPLIAATNSDGTNSFIGVWWTPHPVAEEGNLHLFQSGYDEFFPGDTGIWNVGLKSPTKEVKEFLNWTSMLTMTAENQQRGMWQYAQDMEDGDFDVLEPGEYCPINILVHKIALWWVLYADQYNLRTW